VKGTAGVLVLVLLVGATVCAQEPTEGPLSLFRQGPRLSPTELTALTDQLAVRMSALRGLKLPGPIAKEVHTQAELAAIFLAKLDEDWPPEELARWCEAYEALGLLPPGTDLRALLAAVMTEQLGGAYDPDTKTMYLVAGTPAALVSPVLIHELTHAGQDAHFDLDSLPWDQRQNDDLALAVQALVEGDATGVMFDHVVGRDTSAIADLDGLLATGPQLMGSPQLALAPRVLRELLLFPYLGGFRMVGELRRQGGWKRVNAAYGDLPLSTEQVIHPQKFLGRRDRPQQVVFPEGLGAANDTLIQENVLGEFGLRLLLEEFTTTEEALGASAGWDGDRFRVWRREPAGPAAARRWLIILVTTWDSAADAREFLDAYCHLIVNKYRQEEALRVARPGRRLWRTERGLVEAALRGRDVLVVEGFEDGERETLWQALSEYGREEFRWPGPQPAEAGK
jgi:hypothetical protein